MLKNISLILPTLNNGEALKKHLEHIEPLLPEFGEIIAVDSYSNDGSFELLKSRLSTYNSVVYQRPRGLYESWNDAISKATCEYTYISTIGDLPSITLIKKFFSHCIENNCDLAVSPPDVINPFRKNKDPNDWPIHLIIKRFNIKAPKVLDKGIFYKLNEFTLSKIGIACLTGSFASNLVKTELLKNNKFPTEFNYFGDFLWCASLPKDIKVSIYPYYVSSFLLEKEYYPILSREKRIVFIEKLLSSAIEDEDQRVSLKNIIDNIEKYHEFKKKYNIFRYLIPTYHLVRYKKKQIGFLRWKI